MTFREGDLIVVHFKDHSMNFGRLMDCKVAGFFSHEDDESITINSWSTSNAEAQNESFTIAWGCIKVAYKINVK